MNRKPEIPEPIKSKIDEILAASSDAFREGDLRKSHEIALMAWDLIPEPKERWDYYPQSLSRSFVEDYINFRDEAAATKWVEITAIMFNDPNHEDLEVLTIEAEVTSSFGNTERLLYIINRIVEIYGEQPLRAPERQKWLKIYQSEKGKFNAR
ncbi:MAG: hypothetical protein Q4G14_04345 [Paracoccus sp. (in: a-proteobacteria)]|uniref:hypothetical protein n=1 Tax=Paracoccus sp. TaxID=267 RepID=UPI0026DF2D2F|nr:hypothetical protein [Paracoccus sp. (in: a-proteobacteria)]MDO5612460.1 hypothetical protein [Paracoccus sp. (in: a-proteobacteria)]